MQSFFLTNSVGECLLLTHVAVLRKARLALGRPGSTVANLLVIDERTRKTLRPGHRAVLGLGLRRDLETVVEEALGLRRGVACGAGARVRGVVDKVVGEVCPRRTSSEYSRC